MPYIYPGENGCSVFEAPIGLTDEDKAKLIYFDEIPDGEGMLMINDEGELYYEPFPEIEEPTENLPPTPPPTPSEEIQSQILLNTEMLLIYRELGI